MLALFALPLHQDYQRSRITRLEVGLRQEQAKTYVIHLRCRPGHINQEVLQRVDRGPGNLGKAGEILADRARPKQAVQVLVKRAILARMSEQVVDVAREVVELIP
jgi:RecJ-like exonuclease